MGPSLAELTHFRRALRQCLSDSTFVAELVDDGFDFWTLAPANVPFAWWGDVADIPDGWSVLEEASGRYIIGSTTSSGDLVEAVATAIANHAVTQPTAHPAFATDPTADLRLIPIGVDSNVADDTHTHNIPSLTHTGVTVDAHVISADYVPPSISFIWIMKVEA